VHLGKRLEAVQSVPPGEYGEADRTIRKDRGMKSQILIIASFFLLLVLLAVAAMWIPEAKSAIPFIAGAFGSELAHLARKTAE
jgi:hypothetical protein